MISGGCILMSLLMVGLAYYMYIPDDQIFQLINEHFRWLLGARIPANKSQDNLKDGILTTYESLDGVSALVHRPMGAVDGALHPGIVYFHGGGWISGSTGEYQELTHHLGEISGTIILSIEYRLAPKFPFPIPFEDCLRATLHLLRNPSAFGIHKDKISLAGDDVGGHFALSVALKITKDEPELAKNIRLIGMFYSPLQAFDFNLPSYAKYSNSAELLGREDVVEQFLLYLFGESNSTIVDMLTKNLHTTREQKTSERFEILDLNMLPFSFREYMEPGLTVNAGNEKLSVRMSHLILDERVSPMLTAVEDLKNLPYTYFIAPELDPVRDESFMLYGALREIDMNKHVHVYYRTEKHGFLRDFRTNSVAKSALSDFIVHLKNALSSAKKL